MNKRIIAFSAIAVLAVVSFAAAQSNGPDYSGKWKLDVSKSDLGERARIESMDMTVEQTADSISVERVPKMSGGGEGMGGGMGRGMGRGMMGGGKLSYSLDGKETKGEGAMGSVSLKAEKGKDGGLVLTQNRNLETQMGSFSLKTVEKWELSLDGKILTVNASTETPRGNRTQKLVFTRD